MPHSPLAAEGAFKDALAELKFLKVATSLFLIQRSRLVLVACPVQKREAEGGRHVFWALNFSR